VGDARAKDRPKAAPSPAPEADTARLRLVQAQAPGSSHDVAGDVWGLDVHRPRRLRRGRSSEGATPMIERLCKTCEHLCDDHGEGCDGAAEPCSAWMASRAALEAEAARLTKERDEARANYQLMVDRACDEKLDGYRELGARAAAADSERDAAVREAARLRADVARLESERAGLSYSLTEVEDEIEGERSMRSVFAAQANILEKERDRLRDEVGAMLALIDGNRSSHYGIEANRKFRESVTHLRALLGEAGEGGGA
jgi:hypothetical protein